MYRFIYTLLFAFVAMPLGTFAQCTTVDATGCSCADGTSTNCDLLPDITVSDYALLNYLGGPTEYAQTGNGANNGRLRVSGSTPNIGFGPLTVGAENVWTCGTDTFTVFPGTCSDGSAPKQLIKQKIYHKNGNNMTYWERWAGSMTYHDTHGHMHVDDWGVYTLRVEDPNDPNPLNWPIIGDGAKLGFCLMDYGTCSYYNAHCEDSLGNVMLNGDFPNYGLGGGSYNCSPVEQGITSGYTDIYSENLDGMWIDIPPGTCNGDYWIVMEVDPNNHFIESNEDNNWVAVPFTLTQQVPVGSSTADIALSGPTHVCAGDTLVLTASAGSSYLWSTGDTSATLAVTQAGTYAVTVTSPCGTATSDPITITVGSTVGDPTSAMGDTICMGETANLSATGSGTLFWFDNPNSYNPLASGTSFTTPSLNTTGNYYVGLGILQQGATGSMGPADNAIGSGAYHFTNTRYLTFDALTDIEIVSVWVDASSVGNRTIELRDENDNILESLTVNIPAGQSRVTLNFPVPTGTDYRLGLSTASDIGLFRNDGGVTFPYDLSGIASITGSSAGGQYYYFYYDWEVKEQDRVCTGNLLPVDANVIPIPQGGLAEIMSDAAEMLCANDTVTLSANAGADSYLWSNGATTQNIQVNTTGTYTVATTSVCGNTTSDPVDLTFAMSIPMPMASGDTVCPGEIADLSVQGTGDYTWYDDTGAVVGNGNSYTTPTLSATTTYYVSEDQVVSPGFTGNVGPTDNSIGPGGYHQNNTRYLEFDVMEEVDLLSVWIDAEAPDNRTIELRDANNTVLQSTTLFVPAGQQRIPINFNLRPGTNYRLGLNNTSTAALYRNNSGTNYPYTINNWVNIHNSSAGTQYYYFFYDWELKTPDFSCSSDLTPVTALIDGSAGTAANITSSAMEVCNGETIDLDANSGVGYQWSTGETTQSITINTSGSYSVAVTNGCGTTTADTIDVLVADPIDAPVADNVIICEGDGAVLEASGNGIFEWYDDMNGSNQVGAGNTFVTSALSSSTSYYVAETQALPNGTGTCYSPLTEVMVTVNPLPTITIGSLDPAYDLNAPPVTLAASPAGGTWSGTGVSNGMFDPAAAGVGGPYTITYSYTDANGCTNSESVDISVDPASALDDLADEGFLRVYPNPNDGIFKLTFELNEIHTVNIRLYNMVGQMLMTEAVGNMAGEVNHTFDVTHLPKGSYFVEVEVDERVFHQRVVYQ